MHLGSGLGRRAAWRGMRGLIFGVCSLGCLRPSLAGQQKPALPPYPPLPWAESYFYSYDDAAISAGLPLLRADTLPPGEHEVRIWLGESRLYRFHERAGKVDGEEILYWPAGGRRHPGTNPPGQTYDEIMRHTFAGRCDHLSEKGRMVTCRVRFTAPPPWRRVLQATGEAGLWTLPDPSTFPDDGIVVFDGWWMSVELRDGSTYRAYHYENPEHHPRWPTASRAVAIRDLLSAIDSLWVPQH